MRATDRKILDTISFLNRLSMLKVDNKTRYAIARNLQVLEPLRDAALKAYPVPVHPGKEATEEQVKEYTEAETKWLKDLEGDEREFTEYKFSHIPDFTDTVLAAELKAAGKSQDEIDLAVAKQDQALMYWLRDFIKE